MDKEIGGQPLWIWLVGAVVVVGGYLYFKSHRSAAAPTQPDSSTQPSTSTSSFRETITNLQSNPKPKKKKTSGG